MKKSYLVSLILLVFTLAFLSKAWADSKTENLIYFWVPHPECSFDIVLPANPTTGYQWQLSSYEKDLLKPVQSKYEAAKTLRIGEGGKMRFTFLAQPGKSLHKTKLVFTYLRPWEKDSGKNQTVEVYFECPKDLASGLKIIKAN